MTIVVGNTGFDAVPYGRPIEDIGAGACIVNGQECMDWKDRFEWEPEEQIFFPVSWRLAARKQDERLAIERRLAEPHLVRRSLPIRRSIVFSSSNLKSNCWVVQKEHLNASATALPYFSAPGATGREILASTRHQPLTNVLMITQEGGVDLESTSQREAGRRYKIIFAIVQKEHLNASTVFRLPDDSRQGNKVKDWHWSVV
ncbi:hypothetical protein BGAL_0175g00160 [Botrytis galanthina]|uniref:Uncharacterized protein n=1 Tax=Botrytis galanthina TaxID=278940 RepID=A0A4S8R6L1_9HELO|nr:hypothetical protein BGAL_0175g00160 [Botrytis galanthina]